MMQYQPFEPSSVIQDARCQVESGISYRTRLPSSLGFFPKHSVTGHYAVSGGLVEASSFFKIECDAAFFRYCNLVCRIPEGPILECMPQGLDRFPLDALLHKQIHHDGRTYLCFDPDKLVTEDRPSLIGGHYAIGIFGHFILDLCASAVCFRKEIEKGELNLALFGFSDWMISFLQLLEIKTFKSYESQRVVRFKHGMVTSSVSGRMTSFPGQQALQLFSDLKERSQHSTCTSRLERVYLTRNGDARRSISNEAELRHFLRERGFVVVDPADLSAMEQCHLFLNAKEIVSLFGSTLTLAPLTAGNGRIIEIVPSNIHDGWFLNLSSLFSLDVHPFFARVNEAGEIHVNTSELDEFLRYLG